MVLLVFFKYIFRIEGFSTSNVHNKGIRELKVKLRKKNEKLLFCSKVKSGTVLKIARCNTCHILGPILIVGSFFGF